MLYIKWFLGVESYSAGPVGGKFWRETFLSSSISLFSRAEAVPLLHINAMLHEA